MAAVVLLLTGGVAPDGRADDALFSFGEMRALQRLPEQPASEPVTAEQILLYQNMEFYTFAVIEALLAANNATMAVGGPPLFCAPPGTFRFRNEDDIAALLAELTDGLLTLTSELGGREDRYDDRPASEALLLALRARYACDRDIETVTAQR